MEHIIGLDIETTSSVPTGRIIQVGMATQQQEMFNVDVVYQLAEAGSFTIEPEALEVNGFTLDRIFGQNEKFPYVTRTPQLVELEAINWLMSGHPLTKEHLQQIEMEYQSDIEDEKRSRRVEDLEWYKQKAYHRSFICVGWNVGSFDVPYINREMPRLGDLLHYRTIDLNAVCFTAERVVGDDYRTLKDEAKEYAEENMPGPTKWHDAGYDAQASLWSWDYLVERMSQVPDA